MKATGNLHKMRVSLTDTVEYRLDLDYEEVLMNDLIGQEIILKYSGRINCVDCGKEIKKAYGQGFCYPCLMQSPQNSPCIIRPELCRAHLGEGRDPDWEEKHHNQPHVVYLALTSKVKVGITRKTNVPSRWIDQGAWKALVLARTPNRYECGMIEVAIKKHMSDSTNWRHMLTDLRNETIDLLQIKKEITGILPENLRAFVTPEKDITEITYPVLAYPAKVKSLSFDKTPTISGKLIGIRGQYLLFNGGEVLNIRKFSGYHISIETENSTQASLVF